MFDRTTKAAGLLVVCCTLVACGNNAPSGSSNQVDPEGLTNASLQADFDAFSASARLDAAQRAALLKHFQRFEKHYASLARSGKADLIDRLLEHDRILALSELRADQAKLYDAAPLPGSKAFTPASLQVAGGAQ